MRTHAKQLLLIGVSLAAGCTSGTYDRSQKRVGNSNLDVFGIVSVSALPDESHSVRIDGPDGQLVYYDPTPGIALSDVDVTSIDVLKCPDNTNYMLIVGIRQASRSRVGAWTQRCVGRSVGCIYQGRLICVEELRTAVFSAIGVPCFASLDDACAAAKTLASHDRTHD